MAQYLAQCRRRHTPLNSIHSEPVTACMSGNPLIIDTGRLVQPLKHLLHGKPCNRMTESAQENILIFRVVRFTTPVYQVGIQVLTCYTTKGNFTLFRPFPEYVDHPLLPVDIMEAQPT